MEIVKRLYLEKTEKDSFQSVPCVIAMGTFDGLHRGHRDVIDAAADYARKMHLRLAVFTFSNHPYAAIRPSAIPQSLISPEEKVRLLKRWGVDLLIDVPFDRQLSLLSPEEFLHKLKQFNFSCLVCGTNFSYGFRGMGNTEMLTESGKKDGFDVIIRPLLKYKNRIISSTRIRRAISEGNLRDAENMLGRFCSVQGIVHKGFQRGRKIGFPTANLYVNRSGSSLPPAGVYALQVRDGEKLYNGVGNLGMNPTFDDVVREVLEVHLFGCNEDLYGHILEASFCRFIRHERRFPSVEALKAQLENDKAEAVNWFASQNSEQ
ncbi:MAG: bifunctional riboflavin kinase/FAD synthetase [Acidaminococcaceae bacterium]|nr:bifunctional riboflavin kinase/FAD synthetase [Acidaminococcaceae bacterium]MBP5736714.1 bifunctional riboflavin kinase/FAD synthetase [Acidaminococcaceae bacterium]